VRRLSRHERVLGVVYARSAQRVREPPLSALGANEKGLVLVLEPELEQVLVRDS
jgi:hypothetical protein